MTSDKKKTHQNPLLQLSQIHLKYEQLLFSNAINDVVYIRIKVSV